MSAVSRRSLQCSETSAQRSGWPQGSSFRSRHSQVCSATALRRAELGARLVSTFQCPLTSALQLPSAACPLWRSCSSQLSRRSLTTPRSAGSAVVELLGRELSADEQDTWQASVQVLGGELGLDTDECQRLLARAFGWTTQAFWRREKVDELPTPGQVSVALAFLRHDLALTPEEQVKVVKAFPEILACDLEARLRANVAALQSQWRLQGATLTKAVLRQPQVLGYSVDCSGDCVGECNRCWARF